VREREERGQKESEGEKASRHLFRPQLWHFGVGGKLIPGWAEEFSTTPRALGRLAAPHVIEVRD
jgi:hypothetical protein